MTISPRKPRRLTIADISIFIAAVAAGLALLELIDSTSHYPLPNAILASNLALLAISFPVTVATAILGLLPIRSGPLPPGTIACTSVFLSAIFHSLLTYGLPPYNFGWIDYVNWVALSLLDAPVLATAVGASWLALILARRWEPVPSWPDVLGRFLGAFWMLEGVVSPLLFYLFP